jgi:hypothetical protein
MMKIVSKAVASTSANVPTEGGINVKRAFSPANTGRRLTCA